MLRNQVRVVRNAVISALLTSIVLSVPVSHKVRRRQNLDFLHPIRPSQELFLLKVVVNINMQPRGGEEVCAGISGTAKKYPGFFPHLTTKSLSVSVSLRPFI